MGITIGRSVLVKNRLSDDWERRTLLSILPLTQAKRFICEHLNDSTTFEAWEHCIEAHRDVKVSRDKNIFTLTVDGTDYLYNLLEIDFDLPFSDTSFGAWMERCSNDSEVSDSHKLLKDVMFDYELSDMDIMNIHYAFNQFTRE